MKLAGLMTCDAGVSRDRRRRGAPCWYRSCAKSNSSLSYRFIMGPFQVSSFCFLLISFFLMLNVQSGDAIVCYECNSHNNSECALDKPPDTFKKDCSEHKEGNKYGLCRKIVQSIEFEVNGLKPDTRVIRACGWDKSNYENRCYQRSGFGGRQEVCTCQENLCNAAGLPIETSLLPLAVFSSLHVLFSRYLF